MEINRVHLLDALLGLSEIPDKSVDIVLADPPYNIGKDFGNNFDNLNLNDYIEWCKKWIVQSLRILKDTGTIYIYADAFISPYIFTSIDTFNKRTLIWHYKNKNCATNKFWQRSYESIICIWKDPAQRIFNRDLVREPYSEAFLKGAAGKIRPATPGRFSKEGRKTIYEAHKSGALPRDVICVPALAGGAGRAERIFYCKTCGNVFPLSKKREHSEHSIIVHPTQKPSALTKKLLSASLSPSGLVCLPFCGTGGEAAVARQLGMNFIAFEINQDYVEMASFTMETKKPM